MQPDSLLLYCRPGFEKECAAEIIDQAAGFGCAGYCEARPETGWVRFVPTPGDPLELLGRIELGGLCFARQLLAGVRGPVMSGEDRLTPLIQLLGEQQVSGLVLEGADTNEGKALAGLLKRLERPTQALLESRGLWWPRKKVLPRLHLFFLSGTEAFVALADPANSAPWPMGVQRLRMPPGAPSRSTLKLEEALLRFLTSEEQGRRLAPGMQAVDLGAAPGGWTWQFVRRSVRVTAVDNGPLDPRLLDSGIVDHRREDGFLYRPPKAVDWMVCDMVEQPSRIAGLVGQWFAEGWCRESIFNLKLPMKRRYEELQRCRGIIDEAIAGRVRYRLRFKQLYHDREEVTGHLRVIDRHG